MGFLYVVLRIHTGSADKPVASGLWLITLGHTLTGSPSPLAARSRQVLGLVVTWEKLVTWGKLVTWQKFVTWQKLVT